MSTLLKKKYCFEQSGGKATKISIVSNDDGSNDVYLRTSEHGDDVVQTSPAVSLPTSPVSITPSNDDDSARSSIALSTTEETEKSACTSGNGANKKSVRFSDDDKVFMDNDFAEMVHKCRANIWYTRDEYRTFWNDRMNSVKLWKCLFDNNDLRANGALGAYSDFTWDGKEYTARGLENYVFFSSEEINRQRDLYTVAALNDPYDADRILAYVCDMSIASLQRAQNYALHDAIDSYRDCSKVPSSYHNRDIKNIYSSSAQTRSPSSVLPRSIFPQIYSPMKDPTTGITSVQEMNKRLIKGHLNGNSFQGLSPVQMTLKRRASTSGSFIAAHDSNLADAKRRRSISLSTKNYRQPVSLQMHNVSRVDQQRRRPSMADDFSQHMQFCNRLLNDLPIVDHSSHRRDSVHLTGSTMNKIHDQVDSFAWNYPGNTSVTSMDDEYILQQQMRRDSLCGSRKRKSFAINADILPSSIDTQPSSDAVMNAMHRPHGESVDVDRSLLRRMVLEQKSTSLSDSAMNEYTDCIRSYSRLRRDSLGGNFGL